MVVRRRFASVPPIIMGGSSRRSRSYDVMPASLRAQTYLMSSPLSRADRFDRGSRADDYLGDRVSNASFLSSYAMEEGYDTARKSRNRDAQLLRDATDAVVFSESFATPQASVAARRVMRGQSMAPLSRATSLPPRPLYPMEVDLWDAPRSLDPLSLYRLKAADAATTDYYPELSYTRRPLFYANPWLYRAPSARVVMPGTAVRAKSVSPAYFFPEEPPRRVLMPVFDDWRRAARAKSVPAEVLPYERPWYYGGYARRLSPYYRQRIALSPPREPKAFWSPPTEGLRAHRVPRMYMSRVQGRYGYPSFWDIYDEAPKRAKEEEALRYGFRPRVLASPIARAQLARAWRHTVPAFPPPPYPQESKYGFPLLYGPRRGKIGRAKAALIASKWEVDTSKGRRPRSDYAARKYRAMRSADQESIYTKSPQTAGYYASHPPLPKITERKAIRTDDGYTKPKNLLSWQYRLDSMMRPSDLMYQPTGSFSRIRQQVRAAQEGMDLHRQMLDRYLPEEGADSSDAAARVLRKMAEMDKRYPVSGGGRDEKRSHEAPY